MIRNRTQLPSIYVYFSMFAMAAGSYLAFINLYLYDIGLTNMEIGLFSAVAPLAAMAMQPLFGMAADRARAKNTVAILLLGALAVVSALFPVLRSRVGIATLMSLWTGLHSGLLSISNAVALEHLQELGMSERYGRVRLCYSLGYAVAGGLLGRLVGESLIWIFPVTAALCLLTLAPLALMPKVSGKQAEGERIPWTRIFTYRRLMILFAFSFLLCMTNSVVYTFLPVLFVGLGGSKALFGYSVFVSAVVETPFLLLSGRLIRRFGAERLLMIPAVYMLARWIIVSLTGSPMVVFAASVFHGGGFIVLHLTMARYVADTVHPGLRATGQALVSAVLFSMSRAAGGLFFGWLTDTLCERLGEVPGLQWTFGVNAALTALVAAGMAVTLVRWRRRAAAESLPSGG